ncbi:hypothetical protein BDZ97DRAFT_1201735 [Flammula alnicola]|nr:hypothetical protein BDZ97DRAFT_1201735 [Flammula alnicola]
MSTVTTIHTNAPSEPSGQGSHQSQVGDVHRASTDPVEINSTQVLAESAALERYFENGLMRENGANKEDESEDEEDKEEAAEIDNEDELQAVDNSRTHDALAWADKFILETRRKGGRQTENSVLKLWMSWASIAINSGQLPDIIVDAKHMIAYLKYAATRQLFTRRGENKSTSSRLSAASLKKIMTMLGRVRRRQEDENPDIKISRPSKDSRTQDFYKAVMVQAQRIRLESEDFDITKGTILDSELRPEHFNEITSAIFEKLDQLPSIIKAHFSWTWQCSTLNRSDELVSLLMACIQPFSLRLPDYTDHNGRISPLNRQALGVLAMFHETKTAQPGKTEPKYSFVLPHRDPLRCPVGALAILLHFMFDQEDLMSRVSPWDWENAATWRKVHVLFGRTVDQAVTGDAIGHIFPTVLEEMGVPADQVDATGHWQGNTRREIYGSKIPKAILHCGISGISSRRNILCALGEGPGSGCTSKRNFSILRG